MAVSGIATAIVLELRPPSGIANFGSLNSKRTCDAMRASENRCDEVAGRLSRYGSVKSKPAKDHCAGVSAASSTQVRYDRNLCMGRRYSHDRFRAVVIRTHTVTTGNTIREVITTQRWRVGARFLISFYRVAS